MKTIIVYLAAFITLGNGIALRAPTVDPTGQVSAKTANWSPKITQPPFPFELFKRDYVTVSQSTIVQLWATDNTCGWGNGNSSQYSVNTSFQGWRQASPRSSNCQSSKMTRRILI